MAGKLNGQMAATTPRGSRIVYVSMSVETSRWSPICIWLIPQAASTTCKPRSTSPRASGIVFPCSSVMDAARRSQSRRMRATSLNMTCCLWSTEVLRQPGKAFFAASTAACISSFVLSGTLVTILFVAGSGTSMNFEVDDFTNWPLMKFLVSSSCSNLCDVMNVLCVPAMMRKEVTWRVDDLARRERADCLSI